ncbi:MAG: aldo/keto reductase [Chloroflexota bacterium]|nr:aldo/keto reductase [Chloroflexota bacterium]
MRYRTFGKTGLRVSELCLGAMTFGEGIEWGADKETSKKMFDSFANQGGNFIDTANVYTAGNSEKLIGEFVRSERDYFVVATKYVISTNRRNPNAGGAHRKNMVQALESSLKRLGMDYVDVFWVHAFDPLTPIEEVVQGLYQLVQQGKVLYVGISDAPAWWVAKANTLAELKGWSQFVGLQIEYNLTERTAERELLPMAHHFGMAVTAWSPLASGILTGKYRGTQVASRRLDSASFKRVSERSLAISDTVVEIANEIGCTPAQVAINWVRQQNERIIPIIGSRTLEQLEDNLKCLEFELGTEQFDRLDESSKPELGFPHEFLKMVQPMITGSKQIRKIG